MSSISFSLAAACSVKPRICSSSLGDALVQLRLLPLPRVAAQLEQPALAGRRRGATSGSWAAARRSAGRSIVVDAVALGLEPGLARRQLVEALADHRQIGPRGGLVEAEQQVAGLDRVAIRTSSSPTMPPVGCWTFLTFGSTTSVPGRDDGAGELGRVRPSADAADQ